MKGVEGRLNRGFIFDPQATSTTINWEVEEMFHPMVDDARSYEDVAECIDLFAKNHHAEWAWPATEYNEDHCQTFQLKIMHVCRLQRAPEQVRRHGPDEREENDNHNRDGRP
jgi:hypothetical protein